MDITSETKIVDLSTLEDVILEARNMFGPTDCIWRGHTEASWSLVPGAMRPPGKFEQSRSMHFKLRAMSRLGHRPKPSSDLEWLLLGQHYGLPTRLLDWSERILVALFFAVEPRGQNVKDTTDACLWSLQAGTMNQVLLGRQEVATLDPDEPEVTLLAAGAFTKPNGELPAAAAISAPEIDERMAVQGAAFTLHGNDKGLESLAGANSYLRRYLIPANAKNGIYNRLRSLGVMRHQLFPDLQELSRHLRESEFSV